MVTIGASVITSHVNDLVERTERKPRIKPGGRGVMDYTRKGGRIHCRKPPGRRIIFGRTQYRMETRKGILI